MKQLLITLAVAILLIPAFSGALSAGEPTQGAIKSADGVTISYEVNGSGDPTLVFVHCWCGDSTLWENQVSHFSKTYQIVTLDLAGHGKSGKERKKYTIPAFGADVAAVVKKLKLENIIILGHSMGGSVMVEAANRLPGKVKALIAVDTLHNVEQKFTDEQFNGFMGMMRADFKQGVTNFIKMMFPPQADPKVVERVVNVMSSAPPEVGIGSMEALHAHKLTEAMAKQKLPVYCINGPAFPTQTDIGAKYASSFKAKIMQGVGHFPMLEKPKEFNRLLDETLKEILKK